MSLEELKGVLKETLESRGVLKQLQAQIRAQIFNALDDQDPKRPRLSNENLLINELIREYLDFNGYRNTLSVFEPETGQPSEPPFEPSFLENHLHLLAQPSSQPRMPLLYRMIRQLNEGSMANSGIGFTDAELKREAEEFHEEPEFVKRDDGSVSMSPRRRAPTASSSSWMMPQAQTHTMSANANTGDNNLAATSLPQPFSFTHH